MLAGAEINSVAVHNGIVAVAIQAPVKTDNGRMALYKASDLTLLGSVVVGALPDMVTFTSTAAPCWWPTRVSPATTTRSTPKARSV